MDINEIISEFAAKIRSSSALGEDDTNATNGDNERIDENNENDDQESAPEMKNEKCEDVISALAENNSFVDGQDEASPSKFSKNQSDFVGNSE